MGSSAQKPFKREMEYFIIYHKETNSYFVNKSKTPATSVRHQFSRAFNPNRKDYESDFSKDIREYGKEAFIIKYTLEAPEWMERRAHYVKNSEPNEEVYQNVMSLRSEPTPPIKPEPKKKRLALDEKKGKK